MRGNLTERLYSIDVFDRLRGMDDEIERLGGAIWSGDSGSTVLEQERDY